MTELFRSREVLRPRRGLSQNRLKTPNVTLAVWEPTDEHSSKAIPSRRRVPGPIPKLGEEGSLRVRAFHCRFLQRCLGGYAGRPSWPLHVRV
jgi:hypothetical protein